MFVVMICVLLCKFVVFNGLEWLNYFMFDVDVLDGLVLWLVILIFFVVLVLVGYFFVFWWIESGIVVVW